MSLSKNWRIILKKGIDILCSGVILLDPLTNDPKIKIYTNEKNEIKGDALVIYLREESVTLACQLLDETVFRPGYTIRVQPAVFSEKEHLKVEKHHDTQTEHKIQKNMQKLKRYIHVKKATRMGRARY
jgi:HIV Tat-specific factor 1